VRKLQWKAQPDGCAFSVIKRTIDHGYRQGKNALTAASKSLMQSWNCGPPCAAVCLQSDEKSS